MATCKDCLHYELCGRYMGTVDFPDVDEFCLYWQEQDRWAEVVRCKDCKHCFFDLTERQAHLCMRRENGWPVRRSRKADDFCSYAERSGKDGKRKAAKAD